MTIRPIRRAFGRDRLAILGGPVGAAAALSATHANHAIGTNDFMVEAIVYIAASYAPTSTADLILKTAGGAATMIYVFHRGINKLRLYIGSSNYYSTLLTDYVGRWLHVIVFADRDGLGELPSAPVYRWRRLLWRPRPGLGVRYAQ